MTRTQTRLTGLWITLVLLYVYCDIYSFHRPGYVADMTAGKIGPFDVSQGTLAGFGVLMAVPILMIPACLLLKPVIEEHSGSEPAGDGASSRTIRPVQPVLGVVSQDGLVQLLVVLPVAQTRPCIRHCV